MVAHRESATLAEQFIHETCARQGIGRDHLTIHADRGVAMTSKSVAFLLADLGITKTHSCSASAGCRSCINRASGGWIT
jgi:putative transposase